MADVAIVGGGVVGCAIAYHLTKAGGRVTLLEGAEVGGAASGAAAGILVPPPEAMARGAFGDLCRAGMAVYPALVEALGQETAIDVQYVPSSILLPATNEGQARALKALAGWDGLGAPFEWVEGAPLRALEPALAEAVLGAACLADGHHINPGALTQALARAAQARGAVLQQGTSVAGFLRRGDRVNGVRARDGVIAADHVVLAAGPWTGALARRLGVNLPTKPMRGQMVAYRTSAVRHIIWGDAGYLVPKPGGFLYAGATVEDVGFRPHTTTRGLAWLRHVARSLAPALRYAEVASAWAGLRPGSPDGLPILGHLPGWENVYVASGHFRNGILLGPITGRLIAQLITEGKTEVPLGAFRPERFG